MAHRGSGRSRKEMRLPEDEGPEAVKTLPVPILLFMKDASPDRDEIDASVFGKGAYIIGTEGGRL